MLQNLEARRLLSASVVFLPATGALMVSGSETMDRIEINLERTVVEAPTVVPDGGEPIPAQSTTVDVITVFSDGELVYSDRLAAGTLMYAESRGRGGHDA